MQSNKATYRLDLKDVVLTRVRAYAQLIKLRLSLLVVFSAIFGYLMAPNVLGVDPVMMIWLALGGLLVTGASNTLNQVLEVEYDAQMARTSKRPLVKNMISSTEAVIFALVCGIGGIALLAVMFKGPVPALLGIIALLSYAFVYTPMKRVSPLGVLIGAFPGAMPPLIGWAAATGGLEAGAWMLFLIQFIWQFPHFWAIAWLQDEEYTKAGFQMLPGNSGPSKYTASLILIYSMLLIPVGLLPYHTGMIGPITLGVLVLAGLGFTYKAFLLYKRMNSKGALGVMFASFIYLPVIQIAMMIGKF